MNQMRFFLASIVLSLILASLNSSAHARLESNAFLAQEEERPSVNCSQAAVEQKALIREAEKERFTLRRVELIGNVSIPDELLRQRIVSRMLRVQGLGKS